MFLKGLEACLSVLTGVAELHERAILNSHPGAKQLSQEASVKRTEISEVQILVWPETI